MSNLVLTWVFHESNARTTDRLVLLALADEADDDGMTWPSQRRIAAKARLNRSTVQEAIRRLEDAGEVVVLRPEQSGRGHFSRYIVTMGREAEKARQTVLFERGEMDGPSPSLPSEKGTGKGRKRMGLAHPAPSPMPLQGVPTKKNPHARDPLFDALRLAWGERPAALFGRVKRELLETYGDEVTPALITARSLEAQRRWPQCSPKSLVNNWPDLTPQRRDAGDVAPKPSKSW